MATALRLLVAGDEVLEPHAEDESDPQESRERGEEAAPLDLGKQGRGESGVAAELDQPHLLREPEAAQLVADGVGPKTLFEGRGQHVHLLL